MSGGRPEQDIAAAGNPAAGWSFAQAVLFTGHMIDAPGRRMARFPARAEAGARAAIHASVAYLLETGGLPAVGVAGGASGGDILFHEVCAELGVETRLRLALPPEDFVAKSVAPAGEEWVRRFWALTERLGQENIRVMRENDGLLEGATGNIWQRANLWMVEEVLRLAPKRTLLALWDGQGGDGPGGTEHLVRAAPQYGIRVAPVIATQTLFA